jgi:hypothetical protein
MLREPVNPFTIDDLRFDYSKIDPKFHASSGKEKLTLYKGAPRGYDSKTMCSMALWYNSPGNVIEAKKTIESRNKKAIFNLFNEHTSYYHDTPLLSATLSPSNAQVFANDTEKTIYQLKINPDRCVFDFFNTGKCGIHREYLILGAIFPEEITAVKKVNDSKNSELLYGSYLFNFPNKKVLITDVKDKANWKMLK